MLSEVVEDAESRFVILISAVKTGNSNFKGLYKVIGSKNNKFSLEKIAGPTCLPYRIFRDMIQTSYTYNTVQKQFVNLNGNNRELQSQAFRLHESHYNTIN